MFDLFDPDRTSVGSQWYLRDQLAALYTSYRGLTCDLEWSTNLRSGESSVWIVAGPLLAGSTGGSNSSQLASSLPSSHFDVLTYGAPGFKGRQRYNAWEHFGITKEQYEIDNSYIAAIGSAPPIANVFQMNMSATDGSSQPIVAGIMRMQTRFVLYTQVQQAMS
jgi:hypothetical protein